MASTMQVLLKALGIDIDPAEMMRVAQEAKRIVDEFNTRLGNIERQQERILALLGEKKHERHNGLNGHDRHAGNALAGPGSGNIADAGGAGKGSGNTS